MSSENQSFEQFCLDRSINSTLNEIGYKDPTPIQSAAIPEVMAGHDLMASAQTGTGKTAAYMLPSLDRLIKNKRPHNSKAARILVLAPTRELAMQVAVETNKFGKHFERLRVVTIVGGVPYFQQRRSISKGIDVIVATPGRLIDLMQSGQLNLSEVEVLILDEADRMLDMGFTEDVHHIAAQTPAGRQTLLFSATLGGSVAKIAKKLLNNPKKIELVHQQQENLSIAQTIHYVDGRGHKNKLVENILGRSEVNRTIIFTATKRSADELADELYDRGYAAAALHGDMRQNQRNRTIAKLRHGTVKILVATDVAARGLDITGVSHIINYDIPRVAEDYVHRIGRTGRAGETGIAVSLVSSSERSQLRQIESYIGHRISPEIIPGLEPKERHSHPVKPKGQKRKAKSKNARRRPWA